MASTRSEEEVLDLGRYWLVGGRLLAKIMGGSNTDPGDGGAGSGGAEGGAEGEGESGEGKPGGEGGEGEGGEGEGEENKPKPIEQKPGEDRGAFRARKRAQEAEERAKRAEEALEALQDKDRTETERLDKRATKAEGRVTTLETTVRDQAIQIAFMLASAGNGKSRKPVQWVNAEDALHLARKELDGVKVGDDGEIDQGDVESVVDDLVKNKSYLVRKQVQAAVSGGNVGSRSERPGEPSAADLAKRFPALRSRGI